MAVTAYTGVPGSGKSYGVVSHVIVPALIAGRRVVTNVEGMSQERLEAWDRYPEVNGELETFHGDQTKQAGFFPTESSPDAFVRPGDLVVFDELKLYWPSSGSLHHEEFEAFLRWHRHLVDDAGQSTDVVLVTHVLSDIHRELRGLIERSFRFKKLTAVGLKNRYRVTVYDGADQKDRDQVRITTGAFKSTYFSLYKSFDSDSGGTVTPTDKRNTMFSPLFIAGAVFCAVAVPVSLYKLAGFFGGGQAEQTSSQVAQLQSSAQAPSTPPASTLRIVGYVTGTGEPQVMLSDDQGTSRLVSARAFKFENGRPVRGTVDGKTVIATDRAVMMGGGEFNEEF